MGYGGWMVRSIQELRELRGGTSFKPYAVGECWDSDRTIGDWLDEANAWSDNPVGAFDFPLRWRLCDLVPAAWRGRNDLSTPQEKWTNESGWVDLWASPRGYAVYVPA